MTRRTSHAAAGILAVALVLAACGSTEATTSGNSAGTLLVSPQNSALLIGVNRVAIALNAADKSPVTDAQVTLLIQGSAGTFETRQLEYIGHNYGNIPVYIGTANFDQTGDYRFVVQAVLKDGHHDSGAAVVTVANHAAELPVGHNVSEVQAKSNLRQRIAADPGVKLSDIDSGVPPDDFHTTTVADALARHRPMILYFGEPGRCPSATCGPTVKVLQQIWPQYKDNFTFEHIEIHDPAPSEVFNPLYIAFGLTSEPWVYFVNADGVVADRFEGFVTPDELRQAADGTLAGRVPAVSLSPS
jgi:hypothetical protein